MDLDNYEEQSKSIEESLSQKSHEAVQEDFDKMKLIILKALQQKMALLSNEIDAKNKKLSDRLETRIKSIVELGMIVEIYIPEGATGRLKSIKTQYIGVL